MTPLLPRLALYALRRDAHPILVAARQGRVLHLVDAGCCHPEHSLTPTGRLRRHLRPFCRQNGRAWHFQDQPSRPLCGFCTAIASTHERPTDWRKLDVLDVLRASAMATDLAGINTARRALLEAGLLTDAALRRVLTTRLQQLQPTPLAARDLAWGDALPLDGTTPHPHPPVRHNFAA